jgi:hypothetical protein
MFGGTLSARPEKSDAELQVFVENPFLGVDVSELMPRPACSSLGAFLRKPPLHVEKVGLAEWTRRTKFHVAWRPVPRVCSSTWRGGVWGPCTGAASCSRFSFSK